MAVALHYAVGYLDYPLSARAPLTYRASSVLALVFGAIIVYFGSAFLFGATNISLIKRGLLRKR